MGKTHRMSCSLKMHPPLPRPRNTPRNNGLKKVVLRVSKPDSVTPCGAHSFVYGTLVTAHRPALRRMRPTRDHRTGRPIPYSVLHRNGFAVPGTLPCRRWALTPPFHPCPKNACASAGRYIFCCTRPSTASRNAAAPACTGNPALWCPDFPPAWRQAAKRANAPDPENRC
jgi:hypothetical protein